MFSLATCHTQFYKQQAKKKRNIMISPSAADLLQANFKPVLSPRSITPPSRPSSSRAETRMTLLPQLVASRASSKRPFRRSDWIIILVSIRRKSTNT